MDCCLCGLLHLVHFSAGLQPHFMEGSHGLQDLLPVGFFTGKMNMAFATLWRVLCSTQATAKASPSTGAYLDASPIVNLLPASTLCQLFSQQPATLVLYPQLFWVRWRPIHIPRAVVIPKVKDLLSKARRCSCPHRLDNVYLVLASLSSTRMCFMMNQSL